MAWWRKSDLTVPQEKSETVYSHRSAELVAKITALLEKRHAHMVAGGDWYHIEMAEDLIEISRMSEMHHWGHTAEQGLAYVKSQRF